MNLLGKILPHRLPSLARKGMLAELFKATADAFGCPLPVLDNSHYDEQLHAYALFTRNQAEKALQAKSDLAAVRKKLYENSFFLGKKIRKWFAVNTLEDVMEIGKLLYRTIGVEMKGKANGDMVMDQCYFSQLYSPAVCDLISSLDDGIFSGISGGRRVVFSQRLTEGCECCRAKLQVTKRKAG
jgi:hypothetical protein